jgi:hypothetical protein
MADISTMIQTRIVEAVIATCQAPFEAGDPTRANVVQKGNFQDDPTDYRGVVCVHRNNPKKTRDTGQAAWPDERVAVEMGMTIGSEAVCHWKRRLCVEVQFWPAGMAQADAEEANGVLVARVVNTVERLWLLDLKDEFGEAVQQPANPLVRMQFDEGGGPDDEYAWKTQLFLEYMTVRNPV